MKLTDQVVSEIVRVLGSALNEVSLQLTTDGDSVLRRLRRDYGKMSIEEVAKTLVASGNDEKVRRAIAKAQVAATED